VRCEAARGPDHDGAEDAAGAQLVHGLVGDLHDYHRRLAATQGVCDLELKRVPRVVAHLPHQLAVHPYLGAFIHRAEPQVEAASPEACRHRHGLAVPSNTLVIAQTLVRPGR